MTYLSWWGVFHRSLACCRTVYAEVPDRPGEEIVGYLYGPTKTTRRCRRCFRA